MRYKVVGEIQQPIQIDTWLKGFVSNTAYIILYMEDGSIVEYDLLNPQLPLPSCRALMKVPEECPPSPTIQPAASSNS